jgi:hypothetical protein
MGHAALITAQTYSVSREFTSQVVSSPPRNGNVLQLRLQLRHCRAIESPQRRSSPHEAVSLYCRAPLHEAELRVLAQPGTGSLTQLLRTREEKDEWDFNDERRGANCSRILATLFTGLDTNYRGAPGLK